MALHAEPRQTMAADDCDRGSRSSCSRRASSRTAPASSDNPLPFIEVDSRGHTFPPADQLWAWAHVHVNRDSAQPATRLWSTNMNAVLPKLDGALARIRGRRVFAPAVSAPAQAEHRVSRVPHSDVRDRDAAPAWALSGRSDFASQYRVGQRPDQTAFPYYHRWFFRTGSLGDFEYLVRLLKAKPADDRVGRRDMDLAAARMESHGPAIHAATLGGILRLGGALRVPKEVIRDIEEYKKYENWARHGYPQPIQQSIADFLNLADEYQKPGANPQPIPDPDQRARSRPADHAAALRTLACRRRAPADRSHRHGGAEQLATGSTN